MKKNISLVTILLLLANVAAAASDSHGEAVPVRLIFWQIFNLAILFAGLVYFLRQPVKAYFQGRREAFLEQAERSKAARQAAEARFNELKTKIEDLDRNRTESLARAEAEAADLRKQLLAAADELAARIRQEAEVTARIEIQRARRDLQEQFVKEAVTAARTVLQKDLSAQDQSRLQSDFVKNMEGVRP